AAKAYDLICGESRQPYLGIVLEYDQTQPETPRRIECAQRVSAEAGIKVGLIGAGKYAMKYLLPALGQCQDLRPAVVCTSSGVTARHVARKFGFQAAVSDGDAVLAESDAVMIATRHGDHADLVVKALQCGKPVFVEKPLAITEEQLERVISSLRTPPPVERGGVSCLGE